MKFKSFSTFENLANGFDSDLTDEQRSFLKGSCGERWTVKLNGRIDVNGPVLISWYEGSNIPVKFGVVKGDFDCSGSNLVSLEGSPNIVYGEFVCSECVYLKSLKGSPNFVGDSFICSNVPGLRNLEGAPREVGGEFNCEKCQNLKSLVGAPPVFSGNFNLEHCPNLESLMGISEDTQFFTENDFVGCPKIPKEEIDFMVYEPEKITKMWLKSKMPLKEFLVKRRGQIKGSDFGI